MSNNTTKNSKLVKRVLIVYAVVVLAVMAFLPIATLHMNFEVENGSAAVDVDITALDQITFLFDSFNNYTQYGITYTEEYREMLEYYNSIVHNGSVSWDDQSIECAEKIMFLNLRLGLMQNSEKTLPSLYVGAVLALVYFIGCVVFLSLSVFYIISIYGKMDISERKVNKGVAAMSVFFPMTVLMLYIATYVNFGINSRISMGGGAIATLVICAVLAAGYLLSKGEYCECARPRKRALLSMIASLTVVFSVFIPIVTSTLNITYNVASYSYSQTVDISMDVSSFSYFNYSDEEYRLYEEFNTNNSANYKGEYIASLFEQFSDYGTGNISSGDADELNAQYLSYVLAAGGDQSLARTSSSLTILYLLIAIGGALIFWQSCLYYMGKGYSRKVVKCARWLTLIFAAAALVIYISFLSTLGQNTIDYGTYGYVLKIGPGIIVMPIAVCLMVILPAAGEMKFFGIRSAAETATLPDTAVTMPVSAPSAPSVEPIAAPEEAVEEAVEESGTENAEVPAVESAPVAAENPAVPEEVAAPVVDEAAPVITAVSAEEIAADESAEQSVEEVSGESVAEAAESDGEITDDAPHKEAAVNSAESLPSVSEPAPETATVIEANSDATDVAQ